MSSLYANDDVWATGQAMVEGQPLEVRARATVPEEAARASFKDLMVLVWTCDPANVDAQGMPTEDEQKMMRMFEQALDSVMEDSREIAVRVAGVIGRGSREWRYYTVNRTQFVNRLNKNMLAFAECPVKVQHFADPDWAALKQIIASFEEPSDAQPQGSAPSGP